MWLTLYPWMHVLQGTDEQCTFERVCQDKVVYVNGMVLVNIARAGQEEILRSGIEAKSEVLSKLLKNVVHVTPEAASAHRQKGTERSQEFDCKIM